MPCLVAKPIVNGIEKDLQGQAEVIRLNMLSKLGREIAARYGVNAAPTTIVLDSSGESVYQHAGMPDRKLVVGHVTAL